MLRKDNENSAIRDWPLPTLHESTHSQLATTKVCMPIVGVSGYRSLQFTNKNTRISLAILVKHTWLRLFCKTTNHFLDTK